MGLLKAANTVLSEKKYFFAFIILSIGIFWVLVLAPDKIAGAGAITRSFRVWEYVFLAAIALLASLVVLMQVFSFKMTRRMNAGQSALTSVGFFSAFMSAVFSSAVCGLCVSALFGFLGAGGIIFLVDNRLYVVAGSVSLLLLSLFLSSKRVNEDCDCAVRV
jgi:uncharacterized membrane protein YiaA